MEKMKKQREKETAIVKVRFTPYCGLSFSVCCVCYLKRSVYAQRAMSELQNLRAQIAKKDKEIKASAAKQKKMMGMVAALKKQHATELEKVKLKVGDGA